MLSRRLSLAKQVGPQHVKMRTAIKDLNNLKTMSVVWLIDQWLVSVMLCRKKRMLSILEGLEFELVQGRKEGEIGKCGVSRGISLDI